jgi:hypothetical protein
VIRFEPTILSNKPLFSKFKSKVKDPDSLLHIQLINLGVLGRSKYPINRLKTQKKKRIKFWIKDDANKVIANLIVSVRWIYSLKEIVNEKIVKLKNELETDNEKLKIINKKINNLITMTPSLTRFASFNAFYLEPDNKNKISMHDDRIFGNYYHPVFIIVFLLLICNLFLAFSNPSLAEIMFLLIFFIYFEYDELKNKEKLFLIIFGLLCVKDIFYFFFFLRTDYSQMIRSFYLGNTIGIISKWIFVANFALKILLIFFIFISLN